MLLTDGVDTAEPTGEQDARRVCAAPTIPPRTLMAGAGATDGMTEVHGGQDLGDAGTRALRCSLTDDSIAETRPSERHGARREAHRRPRAHARVDLEQRG